MFVIVANSYGAKRADTLQTIRRALQASPSASPSIVPNVASVPSSLIPITITDVLLSNSSYSAGKLASTSGKVSGLIAGLPFFTDIVNFLLQPANTSTACSVLNLQLSPINLNVLGLHADTSSICLVITATPGGGLLGNVLCSLAGGDLSQLENVLEIIRDSLSILMSQQSLDSPSLLIPSPSPLTDETSAQSFVRGNGGNDDDDTLNVCSGVCQVLNLVLGPVELNLLGLNVVLDDCSGNPVRVCLSASRGEGLLGDLLCGLAGQ